MKTGNHILPLAAAMGSLALAATSANAALVGQLGVLDEAWFTANSTNPDTGLAWQAGDTYHLAFTTVATVIQNTGGGGQLATDPQWADIANWDAVVQAEGDTVGAGAGAGVAWKVIGSTSTVDARDHALVSGPVYAMTGLPLASNYADMWDGEVANEITHIDGTSISAPSYAGLVWTGSLSGGTKSANPLGDTDRFVSMGDPINNNPPVGAQWMRYTHPRQDHYRPASIYGLSEPLTVGGEPSTFAITEIEYDPAAVPNPTVMLTWRSRPGTTYNAFSTLDLIDWSNELADSLGAADDEIPDDGNHITVTFPLTDGLEDEPDVFFRIQEE